MPRSSPLQLLLLQGSLRSQLRFGVLSSFSIRDFLSEGFVGCPGSGREDEIPQVGSIPSKLSETWLLLVSGSCESAYYRTATLRKVLRAF